MGSPLRASMSLPRLLVLAVVSALIVGCGQDGDDLNRWLRKAKSGKPAKIEPLPEPIVYEPMPYVQAEKRTPFEPIVLTAPEIKPLTSDISPDFERAREPLEKFALSELTLVGTLNLDSGLVALVNTPDGEVVRVQKGNFMGRNFGRIESIDSDGLVLREIVKDDAGRWTKRSTTFQFANAGRG